MPVCYHNFLEKIILHDIRVIVDIAAQSNAGNLMGNFFRVRPEGDA